MIEYEQRGQAAWITLDRPEKLNALTMDGWVDLRDAVQRASDEARVAVVTGAGEAFCAGDDIGIFENFEDVETLETLGDRIFDVVRAIEDARVPVIAAADGDAHGGGFEVLSACDVAVAAESAAFSLPETRIGVIPGVAISRVAEFGGRKRAMELMLGADPVDAETAREWGLVNRTVPADDVEATVEEYVEAVCRSPEHAIAVTKRQATGVDEHRERLVGGLARVFMGEDAWEGIEAFNEGRDPEFGQ